METEVINSGTYGQIKKDIHNGEVLKILDKNSENIVDTITKSFYLNDEAFFEFKVLEKIKQIDKFRNWSPKVFNLSFNPAENSYFIKMENCGISLYTFFERTDLFFEDTLPLWHNIIHAVKCLEKNNLTHFDIKPSNIVYSEKYNKFVLIDYGTTTKRNKILEDEVYISHPYYVFPFEFMLFKMLSNKKSFSENNINEYIELYYKKYNTCYFNFLKQLLFKNNTKRLKFKKKFSNLVEQRDQIVQKSILLRHNPDVFSLGLTIFMMYELSLKRNKVRDSKWMNKHIIIPIVHKMISPFHTLHTHRIPIDKVESKWRKKCQIIRL